MAAGLTFVESPPGDFDASDALNVSDVDWLSTRIRDDDNVHVSHWLPDTMFDLNSDEAVDLEDHRIWVKDVAHTWYGDANLDGQFNTGDLVQMLEAGKYETQEYASWSEGDWNGDGVFGTGDLVKSLEDGGYEMGPREPAEVPEPSSFLFTWIAMPLLLAFRRGESARC